MVSQDDAPRAMTVDEWRDLERRSHDAKHEYIDGHVYLMAGAAVPTGASPATACA